MRRGDEMNIILEAIKDNLNELSNTKLSFETRSYIANVQIKLAEAFIQVLNAESSHKFEIEKNHSKKSDLKD